MSSSGGRQAGASVPGRSIALIGDSITYLNTLNTTTGYYSRGYWTWANILLGHRFNTTYVDGVPGSGCTDANWLTRVRTLIGQRPQWALCMIGVNDCGNGFTAAQIIAALTSTLALFSAAGITVILPTITPHNVTNYAMGRVNQWIRQQAANPGVVVVDLSSALCDPAVSTPNYWQGGTSYPNANTVDGLHPTAASAQTMGQLFANALSPITPALEGFALPTSDSANLLTYAQSSWAGGGSAAPTGWTATGAGTYTQVARTDGIPGNWQQIVVAPGGVVTLIMSPKATSLNPGNTVVGFCEFKSSNPEPTPGAGTQVTNLTLTAYAGGTALVQNVDAEKDTTVPINYPPPAAGLWQPPPMVIPATTTLLALFIVLSGGGTYQLGRVGIVQVQ